MSRNLVLGTAFYKGAAPIRVFVESLRRHYQGEIALLVSSRSDAELFDYLRRYQVRALVFDCAHWMPIDPQFARYIRYSDFLHESAEPYDRILLSDVGDVLFQADPFVGLPVGDLLLFLEDDRTRIGASQANALWIEDLYGKAMLDRYAQERISCSGTTIGNHAAMAHYLKLMLWEGRPENAVRMRRDRRGYDQGIHNVLLHSGSLSGATLVPNDAFVWTLHNVPDAEVKGDSKGLYTLDGRYPPVVHQYPTKLFAKEWVAKAYP
jgi:hypothetical protein